MCVSLSVTLPFIHEEHLQLLQILLYIIFYCVVFLFIISIYLFLTIA